MSTKRKIEIFSAGCPACQETIDLVNQIACPSCDIEILDMNNAEIAKRAKNLGIKTVPAVVINGELASCCANKGPSEEQLRASGIGEPL